MEATLRLGRFRGIELGANWSVFVIAALIAWNLADEILPAGAKDYSTVAYWSAGVATVLLFFGGLLAHELGHSLVAQRHGVTVERITLWLFGGVAMLRNEAPDPGSELRIAAAGPVVSFGLAVAFGVLAAALAGVGAPELAVEAVAWLGGINLLLAVFNLAPAAPLDGGRILHALVWRRTGDRTRATMVATRFGLGFGYLLIGVGVVVFVAGDIAALWFAFIGWFLLTAARAEASHVLLRAALAGVRVGDVMTRDPITAPDDLTVDALLHDFVLVHHCSAFPLVDHHDHVTALLTLRTLKAVPAADRHHTRVLDIASPISQVACAAPDEPILDVLERNAGIAGDAGRVLVFEKDRLTGIVSPSDVQRVLEVTSLIRPS